LSVYLRLTDVPVPSIYGPSADERGQPAKGFALDISVSTAR
jgi:hypothetical protein